MPWITFLKHSFELGAFILKCNRSKPLIFGGFLNPNPSKHKCCSLCFLLESQHIQIQQHKSHQSLVTSPGVSSLWRDFLEQEKKEPQVISHIMLRYLCYKQKTPPALKPVLCKNDMGSRFAFPSNQKTSSSKEDIKPSFLKSVSTQYFLHGLNVVF